VINTFSLGLGGWVHSALALFLPKVRDDSQLFRNIGGGGGVMRRNCWKLEVEEGEGFGCVGRRGS
jgi:hypothetical protein